MQRFEDIKNKVERTRQTLTEAAERARKHEELKSTIDELKARTEKAILFKESLLTVKFRTKNMAYLFRQKRDRKAYKWTRVLDEATRVLSWLIFLEKRFDLTTYLHRMLRESHSCPFSSFLSRRAGGPRFMQPLRSTSYMV